MRLSCAAISLTAANSAFLLRSVAAKRLGSDKLERVSSVWLETSASMSESNKHRYRNSKRNRGKQRLANPTMDFTSSSNSSDLQECDPQADAVVGVLSCSGELYCAESKESSLGGYCLAVDEIPEETTSSQHSQQQLTIDSLMYDFCGAGVGPYDTDCTCTNVDGLSLTVTCLPGPTCYDYTNKCDFEVYGCVSYHYILELQSNAPTLRKRIYEQSEPYYERVVYTGVAVAGSTDITGCQVEFNGVQCHSCHVVPTVVETGDENSTATPVEWPCYQFDCSNTAGGHLGNSCDFGAAKVFDYVTYYGCPVCNICEDKGVGAFMTQDDAVVDFFGTPYGCDELDFLGSKAMFNYAECEVAQSYAADLCGCSMY